MTTPRKTNEWDGDGDALVPPVIAPPQVEAAITEPAPDETPDTNALPKTFAAAIALVQKLTAKWEMAPKTGFTFSRETNERILAERRAIWMELQAARKHCFALQQVPAAPKHLDTQASFRAQNSRTHEGRRERLAELSKLNPKVASLVNSTKP